MRPVILYVASVQFSLSRGEFSLVCSATDSYMEDTVWVYFHAKRSYNSPNDHTMWVLCLVFTLMSCRVRFRSSCESVCSHCLLCPWLSPARPNVYSPCLLRSLLVHCTFLWSCLVTLVFGGFASFFCIFSFALQSDFIFLLLKTASRSHLSSGLGPVDFSYLKIWFCIQRRPQVI